MSETGRRRILLAAFFLSGAAALLYEVVWEELQTGMRGE